ncbi:MAG: hypothetical protein K2M97_02780 [Muribaculaceae bacterium]|nr:hypothetical protein [Muribaculaceae bacterium]
MKIFTQAIVAATLLAAAPIQAVADEWEPTLLNTGALKVFTTKAGLVLCSDYNYIQKEGGIYYSEDQGKTWEKSDAKEYYYWDFAEHDEYIWACGFNCRMARSEDGGYTWMTLSFQTLAEEYMDPRELAELSSVQSYAVTYDENHSRLFVGVFSQALGVIYSDDNGETWERTNPAGMLLSYDANKDEAVYDNIYNVVLFKDKIYAMGMIYHYVYDYETNGWTRMRDDNGDLVHSNFLAAATVMNGVLYAARGMDDNDPAKPYMCLTENMSLWFPLPRPEDSMSNYINGLTNDGYNVYALNFYDGVYYTSDEGQTWGWLGKDGYPEWDPMKFEIEPHPTGITITEDYVIICLYALNTPTSGVYRIARPKEGAALGSIVTDSFRAEVGAGAITVSGTDSALITVTAASGVTVASVTGTSLGIGSLPAGVYIYTVTADGHTATGKFIL